MGNYTFQFTQAFQTSSDKDALTFAAFQSMVGKSSLLSNMLTTFFNDGGTITTGAAGQGTGTSYDSNGNLVISIDPDLLPLNTSTGAANPHPLSLGMLADALAHELGHALLPGGLTTLPNGMSAFLPDQNPDQALLRGETAEGAAVTAEFIVAQQLLAAGVTEFGTGQGGTPIEYSDPTGHLTSSLLGALGGTSISSVNTLDTLETESFLAATESIGGAYYANRNPSTDPGETYRTMWLSEWFLNTQLVQTVDFAGMRDYNFTVTGSAATGWTIAGHNILLNDSQKGDEVTAQFGDTLNFTATESASNSVTMGVQSVVSVLSMPHTTTLIGTSGPSDVLQGRAGTDFYRIGTTSGTSIVVCNSSGAGALYRGLGSGATQYAVTGLQEVPGKLNQWTDANSEQLQFIPGPQINPNDLKGLDLGDLTLSSTVGELIITNYGGARTVKLIGFDLAQATNGGGFLGINLAPNVTLNSTSDSDTFAGGSTQQYTLSDDAPDNVAQTFTITVAGVTPADFQANVGGAVEQINQNDTFDVTLAAGQTNVSFTLSDVTTDDGSSDIDNGATITLTASLPNLSDSGGAPITSAPLTLDYVSDSPDTTQAPNPGDVITGQVEGDVTIYTGDGGDDIVNATGAHNQINAANSGNDSITANVGSNTITGSAGNNVISVAGTDDFVDLGTGFNTLYGGSGLDTVGSSSGDSLLYLNGATDLVLLGNGNNQVYANAGSATTLAQALANVGTGTETGTKGDLIAVLDGNNTVVGDNGNDFISAGAGNDVIVLGAGNDTFSGGDEVIGAYSDWSASIDTSTGNYDLVTTDIFNYYENYTNAYPQPYNGTVIEGTNGTPIGAGNDTIFGGSGNDIYFLANGNNYIEAGNGRDTVLGGMGNDTIIAGSGSDSIIGGGGTTYIQGGAGADTLQGGDGNNTIIGGSGNATIAAAVGPDGTPNFTGNTLEQNYVDGGSGNDVIYGSAGSDTLIAGTGNTTIYGDSGNEYIVGGPGNDLLAGGTGNNTIMASGSGMDSLFANGSSSTTSVLYGGDGTDVINGGSGQETLYAGDGGTAGAATTVFASQSDSSALTTIYGGAGVDFLEAGTGATTIYGGDGGTEAAPTTVHGFTGDDTLYGGLGTDLVQGGSGTNVLYAGDGGTEAAPTTVIGGTGVSTIYGGAGPALLQDNQSGQDLIVSTVADDTLVGVGNDTLVAGAGNDLMQVQGGSVTVEIGAGAGNVTVENFGGTANFSFGAGMELADLSGIAAIDANGNQYLDLAGDGTEIDIEGAFTGSMQGVSFADTGSAPMESLLTQAFGSNADATFETNGGSFLTVSLADNDSISSAEGDTVSSWADGAIISDDSHDVVYSAGSDASITSSGGDDVITAAGSDALIFGATGDSIALSGPGSVATLVGSESISVSGANDTVVSDAGNSTLYVNNSSTVIDAAAGGVDTLVSSVSYTAPANVDILMLTGSASLAGTGNADNDTLIAGAGSDTLVAGSGAATMLGGTGNTTFVINSAADVVTDSSTGTSNQIVSSVSYSLPTNVNTLDLTGSANLVGTANGGTDTLISNSGVDTLIGGSGNDTFVINNANDVIEPGTGSFTIVVESGTGYSLTNGGLTLVLSGTENLTGTAGSGNDTLISNSGVDTLIGGPGNDTFVINNVADVVQDTSATSNNAIQASVSFTLPANVNTLTLTGSGSVTGTGNGAGDVLSGNAGNSSLVAGSGVATLVGGTGNTTFVVNSTADIVQDSSATANNQIQASVSYSLPTNVNTLVLTAAGLTGSSNGGADTLVAAAAADTLVGGTGNDTFIVTSADDVVQDSAGTANNQIQSSVGYSLPTNVNTLVLTGTANLVGTGNAAADSLVANAGEDTLIAGLGQDTLVAGSGLVTMQGGTGPDVFVVNNAADVVTVTGGAGADTIESSVSYTLPSRVDVLVLTGSAAVTGTALNGNNSIVGSAGQDTLYAGSGSDTLIAGSGISTLVGGSSADTFVINNAADVLQDISTATSNKVVSSVSYTMAQNISVLELSGSADLVGVGNSASNTLTANTGNDTLVAGSGAAFLIGGEGADLFVVDSSSDIVTSPDYGQKGAVDTIASSVSYTLPNSVNVLLLTGTANLSATGNAHADSIIGSAGADTLSAGTGNDTLVAGSGLATLIGSTGNDAFVINSSADVVIDSVSGHANALFSSASYTLPVNVNTLVLTGSANVVATGNGAADSLRGNAGADTLVAGSGNDTLAAGTGLDTFVAGTGNDTFIVDNVADVIENASATSQYAVLTSSSFSLPDNVNVLTLTGASNNVGTGNADNDTLTGGSGTDTLVAGSGVDTLIGGSGNTTFVVNSTSDMVVDGFSTASNTLQSSVNFSLPTNVNTLVLSGTSALAGTANSGADTLISNGGVDTLIGGPGNDTFLVDNAGDVVQDTSSGSTNALQASVSYSLPDNVNTLILTGTADLSGTANSAADTLISNGGVDTLIGGGGNDTFVVNNAADVVQDTFDTTTNVVQAAVSFTLPTNVSALQLTGTASLVGTGNAGADVLTANSGNDTLVAGSGVATLVGGAGNDVFVVNGTANVVQDSVSGTSSAIQSSVSYSLPTNVNTLVLTGTAGLKGIANSGSDTLISNSGIDTLLGGSGADVFVVNNAADVLQGLTSQDTIESSVNFTLPSGAASLVLLGTAALSATGGAGAATLVAGGGNDTLAAAVGLVTMVGGSGNDVFVINNTGDVVENTSTVSADTILSSVTYSLPLNVDALTLTGTAALSATGNLDAANVLTANSGNDSLIGTAWNNTLNGGAGIDTLEAGPGENLIYAGNGGASIFQPTVVKGNAAGTNLLTQSTIYGGTGYDSIYGGPGADVIYTGSNGTHQTTVYLGSGYETVYAGVGTSTVFCGSGPDLVYGGLATSVVMGAGSDTIYGGGDGVVLRDSTSGISQLVAGSGAETLLGHGGDTLTAGSGADLMYDGWASTAGSTYEFEPGFGEATVGTGLTDTAAETLNDTLSFGAGITRGSLTVSEGIEGPDFNTYNPILVINDGSSAVSIDGGLHPGVISSVQFAGSSPESFTKFMDDQGPASETIIGGGEYSVLSTGDDQSLSNSQLRPATILWAFGNDDVISDRVAGAPENIFAYGDNNTIAGYNVWAGASDDSVVLSAPSSGTAKATLAGANDTLTFEGGNAAFTVDQSTDVVQVVLNLGVDTLDALASYTLPANVQILTLDSSVGGLVGTSNSQGGTLTAGASGDTLFGGSGTDTLIAAGTQDVLVGGTGAETYVLSSATDAIQFGTGPANLNSVQANFGYTLGASANTLIETGNAALAVGNSANDVLTAKGTNDTLMAGAGNDTLIDGAASRVTMIAGSGNDTFIVNNSGDVIQDTYATSSDAIQSSISYTLPTNINALTLNGTGSITATANSANDSITANAGHDTLIASTGNDTLTAGTAADTFVFNSGFGNELITNPNSGDVIQFGSGIAQSSLTFSAIPGSGGAPPSLVITGASGSVTVQGGLLPGAVSAVNFTGGASNTVGQLVAPGADVTVVGSGGNLILSSANGDSVAGGSGQDTIDAWGSGDTLNAGSGGAVIYVGGSGDQATGSALADTLDAIASNDTLIGGSGTETFIVSDPSTVIQATGTLSQDSVFSSVSYSLPANLVNLVLTGTASLQATGNSGADSIVANSGSDTLVSGAGVDTLVGGGGLDTFVVNNAADTIQVSGSATQDIVQADVSYTLPAGFTTLIANSASIGASGNDLNDLITGNQVGDTLYAGSGFDSLIADQSQEVLVGGTGADYLSSTRSVCTLISGSGIDTLNSVFGNDQLYINNSADVIQEIGGPDTIHSSVSYTIPVDQSIPNNSAVDFLLTGSANLSGTVLEAGTWSIQGNAGNDTLTGGPGLNNLIAGTGVDTLIGGAGSSENIFWINNPSDTVIAQAGNVDTLMSSVSATLPAYVDTLVLRSGGLIGTGNSESDSLSALSNGDTLVAGSGNDTLNGVTNSTLVAGSGGDTVVSWTDNNVLVLNPGFGSVDFQMEPTLFGGSHLIGPTVYFGSGIAPADLIVGAVKDSAGDASLVISDSSSSVTLDGALAGQPYRFDFADEGSLSLGQLAAQASVISSTITGGSGNLILQGGSSVSISGGSGNDTIAVAGANDTLVGGTGAQVLGAIGEDESILGGSGNDTAWAYGDSDTLVSESSASTTFRGSVGGAADVLEGGAGNDVLFSLGSNDTLISGTGVDNLNVFAGQATIVVNNSADNVNSSGAQGGVILSTVSYTIPSFGINTLVLIGTANINASGNGGNPEVLEGNSGADSLIAGTGAETLISGSGIDTLEAGSGANLFIVNNSSDVVSIGGVHGTDTVESSVNFSLPGIVTSLVLIGTSDISGTSNTLSDVITANSGNDTLTAVGTGATTLIGGTGNDTFVVSSTKDVVQDSSPSSSNLIMSSANYTLPANVTALTLTGTFALSATGTTADDVLTANSGKDTLTASGDAATLVGGAGNDLFVISSSDDVIEVTATTTADTIQSSVSFSLPANVTRLAFTGSADVAGTGGAQNDTLSANSGNDTLIAGSGAASLVAGTGNDLFVINSTLDKISVGASHGIDTIQSSISFSLPTTVAVLALTGTASLSGTASTAASVLIANDGNDTLTAVGTAATTLVGGAGNDTFVISAAVDVVQDTSSLSSNILRSSVSYTLPTNVNTLVFTGTTALVATANGGNDSLVANTGSDTLTAAGLGGNDTLIAQTSGTDHLVGGSGNELFVVANTADVVSDTSSTASNTIQSSVNYALPTDVNTLILTGTAALKGTANTANDTLVSNSGLDTLVGGTLSSSNDLFVINNSLDVITLSATHGTETIQSSVSYSLPTTINNLVLAGTVALKGTANSGNDSIVSADSFNDTLVALAGADTLVSGTSGTDSLVGGTGNDTFVVNNTSDVVTDTSTTATNVLDASVSYTLPTNVNTMVLTGTAALVGTGNAHADTITGNGGADTLVAGSGLATLIGGTGTDTFVVDSTGDVVSVTGSGTNDVIQSSVNYTLPTNVQYLTLTGTAALKGTGNSLTDLIVGNTGNDTLTGGSGIAVLEGGRTAGSDVLTATGNQAALIAGAGASTLTGGAFKDFLAAGLVSDSITTGATANVVAVNSGDGATTLQPTSGASDVLSLGAGIDTENLTFTKSGNNLILQDGVTGDSVTLTNWYLGASDQNVTTLQVVEIASASYNGSGSDPLRNEALEEFNFASLVSQFNTAGSPTNWALSNGMPTAQLSSSATAAYGGDLAYYYGLKGNLTGMNLSAAQSTLTNASFATGTQTIDSWSSISGGGGGGGLELLARRAGGVNGTPADARATTGTAAAGADVASTVVSPAILTAALQPSDANPVVPTARSSPLRPLESTLAGTTNGAATPAAPPVTVSLAVPAFLDPVRMGWIDVDRMADAVPGAAGASEPGPDPEMLGSALALSGVAPLTARRAMSGGPGRFDLVRVQMD